MPMPKSKITRSRRGARRAHTALKTSPVHNCPNCEAAVRPHHACQSCGYYKDREVIALNE